MVKFRSRKLRWIASFVCALLLFLISVISCNSNSPGSSSQTITTTSIPKPIESPKGPGAANLTATALATPIPTVCPDFTSLQLASTLNWQIYKDGHFPFQFSFPPGWRVGSSTNVSPDGSESTYIVQIFPPTSTAAFDWHSSIFDPEHFEIHVTLTGKVTGLASDNSLIPENISVAIGNTKSNLYDRISPDCEEIERFMQVEFGQHYYYFRLVSVPGKAQQDINLFLGLLASFSYKG